MNLKRSLIFALSLAFVFVLSADVFAQGKGRGNGGGNGKGSGQSQGKSKHDDIWDRDDDRGKGRSKKDDRLTGSDNRFKGLSKKLGRSPESLRDQYYAERAVNPRLNYGQFVAAHMVARNHNMSPETILRGLRRGDSIGQTLKRDGWDDDRISRERNRLRRMRGDGWGDYVDRAADWILR
jgi:hypothetical protein